MLLVNGKSYYYSFDLTRVASLYDFIQNDKNSHDDECVKFKVAEVAAAHNNHHKHLYYLVNYDKKKLKMRISDGLECRYEQYVRSVILNADRKVVCFSPPMCEPRPEQFNSKDAVGSDKNGLDLSKIKFAEEFVEGTMVNLFYNTSNDVQGWEFSTKNVVSPLEKKENESGVVEKKCFRRMFLEACDVAGLKFDDLPREYSYSFVLQHPDNTIVAPVKSIALYIIAIYYIDGTTVYEMDRSVVNWSEFSSIHHPARFGLKDEEDLQRILSVWASNSSLYYYPGVMFRTHEGRRYKFRNPNYECAKNAKGAEEKSRFTYLHLKKLGALRKHFDRFSEDEPEFMRHEINLKNYTHNLHQNYFECFVNKKKPLKEYDLEYKKNMFQLHQEYKTTLNTAGKCVTMSYVTEFVNKQSLSSQLFVLRKFEDSVNVTHVDVCGDKDIAFPCDHDDESGKSQKKCPGAPRKYKI